jgi:hypothetical protein
MPQDLDRHFSVEAGVGGFPNHTHAALADLLEQAVVQQLLSGFDGHMHGFRFRIEIRVYLLMRRGSRKLRAAHNPSLGFSAVMLCHLLDSMLETEAAGNGDSVLGQRDVSRVRSYRVAQQDPKA